MNIFESAKKHKPVYISVKYQKIHNLPVIRLHNFPVIDTRSYEHNIHNIQNKTICYLVNTLFLKEAF